MYINHFVFIPKSFIIMAILILSNKYLLFLFICTKVSDQVVSFSWFCKHFIIVFTYIYTPVLVGKVCSSQVGNSVVQGWYLATRLLLFQHVCCKWCYIMLLYNTPMWRCVIPNIADQKCENFLHLPSTMTYQVMYFTCIQGSLHSDQFPLPLNLRLYPSVVCVFG